MERISAGSGTPAVPGVRRPARGPGTGRTPERHRALGLPWLAGFVLWASFPHAVAAQEQLVLGRVLDDVTERPVPGAQVTLLLADERLSATTVDDSGGFLLVTDRTGTLAVEVQALGYRTHAQPVELITGDRIVVTLRVRPDAIPLEPLVVTSRSNLGRNLFAHRRQEWGRGIFLDPDAIAGMKASHVGEYLSDLEDVRVSWGMGRTSSGAAEVLPRISTYMGSGCLRYMVDLLAVRPPPWDEDKDPWTLYPLDGVRPEDIAAVEVYRYVGEAPPEIRQHATWGEDLCGLVVLWTHAGW